MGGVSDLRSLALVDLAIAGHGRRNGLFGGRVEQKLPLTGPTGLAADRPALDGASKPVGVLPGFKRQVVMGKPRPPP